MKHIKYQLSEELYIFACEKNRLALEFVREFATNQICLVAVNNNGLALKFISNSNMRWYLTKNQMEKLCLAACSNNGLALEFV